MINVLIAGNQTLTREGVVSVLSGVDHIAVAGSVTTLAQVNLFPVRPDVLVVILDDRHLTVSDLAMLQGYGSSPDMRRVLILSDGLGSREILGMIEQGIQIHVNKDCTGQEFIEAVNAASSAEQYLCRKTRQLLFGSEMAAREVEHVPALSHRETEIVRLISVGLSNKEIAERLFLSFHTVKTHRKNIIKKLGFTFKNASELALIISYLNDIVI